MRILLVASMLILACSRATDRAPVVFGSTSDPDSQIVGEFVAKRLEDAGCTVERRFDLGDAVTTDALLLSGEIDAYVESQRTALVDVLGEPLPETRRVETVLRPLSINRGLDWSPPLGVGDLAVTFRKDIDEKCRAASRALMRTAYTVDAAELERMRRERR